MNPLINPFCNDCWNRMRNTSSPIAAMSSAKRTLERDISLKARNMAAGDLGWRGYRCAMLDR